MLSLTASSVICVLLVKNVFLNVRTTVNLSAIFGTLQDVSYITQPFRLVITENANLILWRVMPTSVINKCHIFYLSFISNASNAPFRYYVDMNDLNVFLFSFFKKIINFPDIWQMPFVKCADFSRKKVLPGTEIDILFFDT